MSNGKITKLQINMAKIEENIGFIKEALVKNDYQHKELIEKIDSFVHSANERFLDKSEHEETLKRIDGFVDTVDKKYVTKESFSLVQKIVYGIMGAIGLAFLYALIELVIK
jgi:hypothetical protein